MTTAWRREIVDEYGNFKRFMTEVEEAEYYEQLADQVLETDFGEEDWINGPVSPGPDF